MDGDVNGRKHPDAECERCPLREVGRFVPSSGPARASLAFVGEAPGLQEARRGIPFTGPSGKLLDTINEHHGIRREDVFLSNACLCRPPDNGTPPKLAIDACRGRLIAELSARNTQTVVALGNSATQALLGVSGVTRLRIGPGRDSQYLPGVRVIPTFHPAAALRQADLFPSIVADIGKVVTDRGIWIEPTYVVADTELDALRLLREVEQRTEPATGSEDGQARTGILVIDIEVDIEKDTAFDHPNHYGMLCVGICYARSKVLVLGEGAMGSERVWAYLGQLLSKRRLVCQQGKFDFAGLYPKIKRALTLSFDTLIASYVVDERPGVHSLDYLGQEFIGAPDWKHEIDKYQPKKYGYGVIPKPVLYKYNAWDCSVTWDVMEYYNDLFDKLPEGKDLRKVHDFLCRASDQIMFLELNGIGVDRDALNRLHAEYAESLAAIEAKIDKIVGKDYDKKYKGINPASWMQVKAALKDMNVEVDSTNEETINLVIAKVAKTDMPNKQQITDFCTTLLEHRKEAKAHGTYVKGIQKRLYGGRVYSSFLLHGTTTGRLSSRNPNLQNIPRDRRIRDIYVPTKAENVFLQTDYSQAELRVLSFVAGDEYFKNIFNAGEIDVFDDLTPIVFPLANDKAGTDPAAWKELRIRVKAYVYGLAYGRTPYGLAKEHGYSPTEAANAYNNFFEVIPEITAFLARVRQDVRDGKDLITPWGRHRRFGLLTSQNVDDIMRQAQAFIPQSTASDMTLLALTNVRPQLKGLGYIRNIVHDSLLVECHENGTEEVQAIVERSMIEAGQHIVGDYVRMEVETKVGRSWGAV